MVATGSIYRHFVLTEYKQVDLKFSAYADPIPYVSAAIEYELY